MKLAGNNKGWFITHILVKDITQIENFFGRKINIFLNIKVQEVEQVEDNLILFIVSSQKQAEIVDFKLTVKGVLNV
jgi:hypothetical protein